MTTDSLLISPKKSNEHNGSNPSSSPISKVVSSRACKMEVDDFSDMENAKTGSDCYFEFSLPSFQTDSQKSTMSQMGIRNTNPVVALQPRSINSQMNSASGIDRTSANVGDRRSSSAKRRPATPTGRHTLPATIKPSRASTPTMCSTLPSTTCFAYPAVKSSTPSDPDTPSSTPSARSSVLCSKKTSRSATQTQRSSTLSSVSAPPARSSSVKKSAPSNGSAVSRCRPASASRCRPGALSARSASSGAVTNREPRQQTCTPLIGRTRNGSANNNRSCLLASSRVQSNNSDNVSPVLIGTQMVERIVNMRKLAPPKLDDHCPTQSSTADKFSSLQNSSGFGRTLSKTSLDMALRHMDITRTMSGHLKQLITEDSS